MAGDTPLLPVAQALARLLARAEALPKQAETIPIIRAAGRVLAADLVATRTQPPFAMSSMDGYALRAKDCRPGEPLRLLGESAAGHPFEGRLEPHTAIRIFTGAKLPDGADAVLIQEDARAQDGLVTPASPAKPGSFIRRAGRDFTAGETGLSAGTRLSPADIALAAAMNHACVPVYRQPRIALLATGDELALPGPDVPPAATVASNLIGLSALVEAQGGLVLDLGIARDTPESLNAAIDRAMAEGADLLVTIGGASVGDRDLVRPVLTARGALLDFYRIAMRPGKPLNFGSLGAMLYLGLPGNPVSALVCGTLFLAPLVLAMQADAEAGADRTRTALLGRDLPQNDRREDYLRASLSVDAEGVPVATPFADQDSSLLSVFARAGALVIRAPGAAAATAGQTCRILYL
ncbi:MAG: molybdopterin molybdotransferase MoeA [Methylobacterium sp.]|nr:molybdopterin molybdotransferase MoeA [Methylobacterium sp.]MCA3604846.1 molybdopterin molybdotransferase MoeA [Methylobacterium sp.]MCA3615195.1 molybdopterin molybdotransferase MoeA [Methylobacterium sp.]